MKPSIIRLLTALLISSVLLYSCNKPSNSDNIQAIPNGSIVGLHNYGVIPMQPDQWANVPVFSSGIFSKNPNITGLTPPSSFPTKYLLYSPQVRDQGQIGSCTGFCGTETDEILYYYKNNSSSTVDITNLTTSTGASMAKANEIPLGPYTFSPLFLYFVERVVINKGSISSDPGAYMVNIGQALQGSSTNVSGNTITPLIYNNYTFLGISNEIQYSYPFVSGSGGYNVATKSTYPYQVYPYSYYSYGSSPLTIPNSYFINPQTGGTSSSNGTTTHGYYVITSTGSNLIADVKTAIANNKPVMMGFNVYDKPPFYPYFESLNTTKYTYNPLTSSGSLASGVKLLGGHAVPLIGYIDDTTQPGGGVFICENSWGTPWGSNGYFYLPYSVLQSTKVVPSGNLYVVII